MHAVYEVKAFKSLSIVLVVPVLAQQSLSVSMMVKDGYSGLDNCCLTRDPMELENKSSRIGGGKLTVD